jgi:hypothetical protein
MTATANEKTITPPIEVMLKVDANIVKETLSRMGIVNRQRKVLYPSCYLIEQFGRFYVFHFKELFAVTRSNWYNNLSEEDIHRKNAIVYCLKQWGMIETDLSLIEPHDMYVFVLPHSQKKDFLISHKFNANTVVGVN